MESSWHEKPKAQQSRINGNATKTSLCPCCKISEKIVSLCIFSFCHQIASTTHFDSFMPLLVGFNNRETSLSQVSPVAIPHTLSVRVHTDLFRGDTHFTQDILSADVLSNVCSWPTFGNKKRRERKTCLSFLD